MSEFRMPSLGADMEKGVLVEWNYGEGDYVKKGDIIALVETDKGLIDIEVYEEGVISEIRVNQGEEVPVGEVLAVIGEKMTDEAGTLKTGKKSEVKPEVNKKETEVEAPDNAKPKISPRARRLAEEFGLDIHSIRGTGPGGLIEGSDVEKMAESKRLGVKKEEEKIRTEKKGIAETYRIRHAIANAMTRSNREIPHYYIEKTIEMENALEWLNEQNSKRTLKERFLPAVLLIRATARALRDNPELNAVWENDTLRIIDDVNIGFSVSLKQGGIINTVIKDADKKDYDETREVMNDLIKRARSGRVRSSEITGSTVTLTYLGDRGADIVYGVIYPPQVALVGFGRILSIPVVTGDKVIPKRVIRATLSADHRATDGITGSRFLKSLDRNLQEAKKNEK